MTDPAPMHTPAGRTDDLIDRLERLAQPRESILAGGRMAWRRFGAGPPIVLLHGGHGSWLHWARNIEPLAERLTVWVPDLPGFGRSDPPAGASMDALLDATLAGLESLLPAGAEVRLAGFSFGGLVAAHLAARIAASRSRAVRLALLGPGGHGGRRRPRGELVNWHRAAKAGDPAALAAAMKHNLAVHMLHDPAAIDALALRIHTVSCLHTRFRSKDISRAGGLGALLERHHGRLLLAWGEHDVTAVPEELAGTLAAQHPDREVRIVPAAGHWVQYESPGAVNRVLLEM